MAPEKKVVTRVQTPTPPTRQSSGALTPLPDDLLAEQCARLALLYAVGAALWTIGLVTDWLLPLGTPRPSARLIESLGIVVGLGMLGYARFSPCGHARKINAGLAYLILNAFGIAMLNTWVLPPPVPGTMIPLSWITILILIYAMISPVTPRKMLAASVAAASMDPLGVWFAYLRGVPVPSVLDTFILYWPNYACAIVAILPSHVVQRLGRQLHRAREMGSYELVELLGRGGMGEVWRARHRLLARNAAIKLVRPEMLGAGSEAEARAVLRRFEREAKATAALSSPHTIQVFDFGMTDDGNFYYVMELLTGRDLQSLVREFGPVPAERAIFLLRQVSHSLADAHARGLVHRDIKPANIYVCRMGLEYDFVKVLDFGLVKVNRQGAVRETLITTDQTTTGTPAYMAPETILGEADVDRRADVYALGCVAYYLLTGHLVFEADTLMKMLLHHVQTPPIPPSQRTELRIPREVDELVLACLEKDPNRRPQDAQALFQMACLCTSCDSWNQDRARSWWERHLPELTGPLTLGEQGARAGVRTVAVQ